VLGWGFYENLSPPPYPKLARYVPLALYKKFQLRSKPRIEFGLTGLAFGKDSSINSTRLFCQRQNLYQPECSRTEIRVRVTNRSHEIVRCDYHRSCLLGTHKKLSNTSKPELTFWAILLALPLQKTSSMKFDSYFAKRKTCISPEAAHRNFAGKRGQ